MGAMLTTNTDCVSVRIFSKLSYTDWETLRTARNQALAANLPLHIKLEDCRHADMGGIGMVKIAQEKLAAVDICGCTPLFAECFRTFGVCNRCTHRHEESCGGRIPAPGGGRGASA